MEQAQYSRGAPAIADRETGRRVFKRRAESPRAADLQRLRVFAEIGADAVERLIAFSTLRQAHEGEEIPTQRSGAAFVIFPLAAAFRITLLSLGGRQCVLRTVAQGHALGDLPSVGLRLPRGASVICQRSGDYIEISAAPFAELARESLPLCAALLRAAGDVADMQSERVFELCTMTLRGRLQAEILRLVRASAPTGDYAIIAPAPTHEVLAHTVGGTREGVTRELRWLGEQKLIRIKKRKEIQVLSIDRLRAVAGVDAPGADAPSVL